MHARMTALVGVSFTGFATPARGMAPAISQSLKLLGSSLILLALFASGAKAETVLVDPGEPGEGAKDFGLFLGSFFSNTVVWTDNKTLEWEAGIHFWLTPGVPGNLVYTGVLLDENLEPIPDTAFAGTTPGSNDPVPLGVINLMERTVFSGMLITSSDDAVDIDWNWDADDRPLVGLPEPSTALPCCLALLGLGWRRRRATASGTESP